MRAFHLLIRIIVILLIFASPQASVASTCSPQGSCRGFPSQLAFQCVEKGSRSCDPKSQFYKECCEGVRVYQNYGSPFCCAYWPYIPGESACCDGTPYSRSWEGCCRGSTYLLDYDTCCEGRIVPWFACCNNQRIDPKTTGCCKGKPYNYKTQACCNGKVICASSVLCLTPKDCKGCLKRDPSCFYATVEGSNTAYFAQPSGDGRAVIFLPNALCPGQKVQVCMHPKCGTSPIITGNPKAGYVLQGVCQW